MLYLTCLYLFSQFDEAAEKKAAQERKAAQLKAFEDKWKVSDS